MKIPRFVSCYLTDWEFRRETNNLFPKEDSYKTKSLQPETTKVTKFNLECTRVRNNREIKCQLARQQEGHFRQAVITSGERSTSPQCMIHRVPQIGHSGLKSAGCKECREAFKYQSHHTEYEKSHKEKDSKCGECVKAFNNRSNLIKHQNENKKCAVNY